MHQQLFAAPQRPDWNKPSCEGTSLMRTRLIFGMANVAISLGAVNTRTLAGEISDEWLQHWQDDLRFIARELPATHPNPFRILSRGEFDQRIDDLIKRSGDLSHRAILLELTKIISALGDGHTRVTLPLAENSGLFLGHSETPASKVPDLVFEVLPIRLANASDGTIIYAAHRRHVGIVGAVVERIGNMTIDQASAAVATYVHRDNEHQLAYQLPDYLILPDVLAHAGVIDSTEQVPVVVRTENGERIAIEMEPLDAGAEDFEDLYSARKSARPLYAEHNERPFWYQVLDTQNAVYWQYNEVDDAEDETLIHFTDRLFSEMETRETEKLIIDLRRNRGGNNGRNMPILRRLGPDAELQNAI
jgi:hypothetical protein